MTSTEDAQEPVSSGWTPETPLNVPPILLWPPRPVKILQYLYALYFPWVTLYAVFALLLYGALRMAHADFTHFACGWIALMFGLNMLFAVGFYGGWHHHLYGRRAQGIQFKYNARWPATDNRNFLFGRQTASNVVWSLTSGVPIWSGYAALTLWAQARGFAPLTSWSQSPMYCTLLMLLLPFFHALHFYLGHRTIHWPPLYNTVHYLHHRSINPGPWSGLAMHPVEHLIYFSGALLFWVLPSTPLHVLYFTTLVALAPGPGHAGFGKMVIGNISLDTDNFYHYLHHKYFKVNFGDSLLIPLDRLFGTFHDGNRHVRRSRGDRP
jgi:sterol desaturase/sphingolipid hydroxylase (fatty acid hydroxylase superfamily)